jgi:hypothetical protein
MRSISTKSGLTMTIILLLAYLAFAPVFRPFTAAAQAGPVKYLIVENPKGRDKQQAVLDKYGAEGWQLVAVDIYNSSSFIFRR